MKNKFLKNIFIKFSTQVIKIIPFVICNLILAEIFTPSKKGEYEIIILIVNTLYYIFNFGIPASNSYLIARHDKFTKRVFSNTISFNIILSIIINILMFFILPIIIKIYYRGIDVILVRRAVLVLFFLLSFQGLIRIFEGKRDFFSSSKYDLIFSYLWFVMLLSVYFLKKTSLNIIINLWIILYIISFLLLFIHFLKNYGFSLSRRVFKWQLKYGIKFFIVSVIFTINYKIDMLMLGAISGTYYAGIYSISVFGTEILLRPIFYISSVLFPTITANLKKNNKQFIGRICRISLLFTIIIVLIAFFTGRFFIKVFFKESYFSSLQSFYILLPGIIFFTIGKILSVDLNSRNKPQINIYIYSITIIINILLNFFLIQKFQEKGAALSTTFCNLLSTVLYIIYYLKKMDFKLPDFFLINKSDIKSIITLIKK